MFESGRFFPVFEQSQVVNSTIGLIYARKVNFIKEFQGGSLLGIIRSALNRQAVDPVLEIGLNEGELTL